MKKDLLKFFHCRHFYFLLAVLLFGSELTYAQRSVRVSGIVTDSLDNGPLPGVSVIIRGSSKGAVTNGNGNYSIDAAADASLVFRYLGYEEKVVNVNNNSTINVKLIKSSKGLDEVVVVGFGTQKKVSVIGAISTITTREIKQSPSASLSVTLAGRLPGLTSMQRTGEPGLNSIDLYIRGRSTVNDQRPLLMVDGVERAIDALDPNEIESVSILKDATATAVYGVRGANGVILVTTRRGSSETPEISLSFEKGLTNFTRFPNAVGAYDFASLVNEANKNDGTNPRYTQEQLEGWRTKTDPIKYPDHNWYKEFTKDFSDQNRVNLNVSGGSQKMQYFISGGYLYQGGQFRTDQKDYDANTNLNRYNFRANFDVNLTKTLKASLTSAGYLEKQNRPAAIPNFPNPSLLIVNAMIAVPSNAHNILSPDGEVLSANGIPGGQPIYGLINRSGYVQEDRNSILATFAMEQKLDIFTEGLSVKAQLSFDSRGVNTQRRQRTFARYRQDIDPGTGEVVYALLENVNSPLGAIQQNAFESFSNTQLSINYQRTFANDHNVSGLFLFNQDKRVINIELPYNLRGFVGRGTYNYKNKYFSEFNFGFNGSEQFAKGKRYGFFPSVSAGWLLSEESFLKDKLPGLSLLKLRASFGLAGNDRFVNEQNVNQRFLYLDDYSLGAGYSNIPNRINENLIGNRNITWETSKKLNIGIDASLFNNLTANIDLFRETRNDVLIRRGTIPALYGTGAFAPLNYGEIQNKGLEIQLSYTKRVNNNLYINTRLNGSYAKNKVLFLDEPLLNESYAYRTRQTGFSLGQPFGLKTAGFFSNDEEIESWADQTRYGETKPGDLKYIDQNSDNKIDDADFVPIGNPNLPLMNFGGAISITYKNIDFSVLVQGQAMVTQQITGQAVYGTDNLFDFHLERWTPERLANGENISFPRLSYASNMNRQASDFYTQRSDFLRLKNAEIGYSLPVKVSGKVSARKVRFYANGLNLFFIYDKTKFKQVDPESAQGGGNQYPLTRVFNFGVNATF
jgi:TonB-linked SusC/RagA family outer membrane protein